VISFSNKTHGRQADINVLTSPDTSRGQECPGEAASSRRLTQNRGIITNPVQGFHLVTACRSVIWRKGSGTPAEETRVPYRAQGKGD